MKDRSKALGVDSQLTYHGMVSHEEVQLLMQSSDLFLFTSIMEGTPHVVQEAIANHLPVICLDTCGQGDCVTNECGRKVPLSDPETSVAELAKVIRELYNDRDKLKQLSDNCFSVSQKMSWDNKAGAMLQAYKNTPPD